MAAKTKVCLRWHLDAKGNRIVPGEVKFDWWGHQRSLSPQQGEPEAWEPGHGEQIRSLGPGGHAAASQPRPSCSQSQRAGQRLHEGARPLGLWALACYCPSRVFWPRLEGEVWPRMVEPKPAKGAVWDPGVLAPGVCWVTIGGAGGIGGIGGGGGEGVEIIGLTESFFQRPAGLRPIAGQG